MKNQQEHEIIIDRATRTGARTEKQAVSMETTTRMELRPIEQLVPYAKNARTHSDKQIEALRASLREFGFVSPILIDHVGNIIAGHGRLAAAKMEGMTQVPCVLVEHLTDAQRRAYILADNRLAESAEWNRTLVLSEISELQAEGLDVTITGFNPSGLSLGTASGGHFWGEVETESTPEYDDLIERNTVKLTTDDCYTPDVIYDAVKKFVLDYYGISPEHIIRPFYPGGDYQSEDYSGDCIVIDNPPFSILSEVVAWYMEKGVRFFLFAPALTLFSTASGRCNYIPVSATVIYENGAKINTSFVTDLGDYKIDNCPGLYSAIKTAVEELRREKTKALPTYIYPDDVVSNQINTLSKNGISFQVKPQDCYYVRSLDSQKKFDKAIYGGGFLLSEKAAAEKAAAEKAAAEKAAAEKAAAEKDATEWTLSDREIAIIKSLGGGADG